MSKKIEWSLYQIQYLKENFSKKKSSDIIDYLGLTQNQINKKSKELGLVKEKYWSKEAILFLKDNFYDETKEILIKVTGKTWDAIHHKAQRLNLKRKNNNWKESEINYLKHNYLKKLKKDILVNIKRSWKAILHKAEELDLGNNYYWKDDEVTFLKQNYLDFPKVKLLERIPSYSWELIQSKAERLNLRRSNDVIQEQKREYCLKHYDVSHPHKLKIIRDKTIQTKKENGSLSISLFEEYIQKLLDRLYPLEPSEREYCDILRYPSNCDFYIHAYDFFIEIQGYWTHSEHPYSSSKDIPEKWIQRQNEKSFKNAIEIYSKKDVKKRENASHHNLNYLEIWNHDKNKGEEWLLFLLSKQGLHLSYGENILQKEFMNISNGEGDFFRSPNQNKIVEHFQPHFYKKERSLWNNPKIREKLVANREKYKFKPKEDLKIKELLQGFKISGAHIGYSFFSPLWIKAFIEKYDVKSIYDPCMGWGHRLLGSGDTVFIGNDICEDTYLGNKSISNHFSLKNKTFYNYPAEDLIPKESYEAVFTCPPYFNTEIYEGKDTSTSKYPDYDIWLDDWWGKVVSNCLVKKPKYFAFVINNKYKTDMLNVCLNGGMTLLEEIPVGMNLKNHFQRTSKNSYKGETLLVLTPKK